MAGSLPSAEELATIPRMGEIRPRLVTGARTPPGKLSKMHDAIEATRTGTSIRRNKRKIAKELATIRKDPDAAAPTEKSYREWAAELRGVIAANRDWWRLLTAAAQDAIIDLFWERLTKGVITYKAFRLELQNHKIGVVGLPKSAEDLRREEIDRAARERRLEPSPPCGGW